VVELEARGRQRRENDCDGHHQIVGGCRASFHELAIRNKQAGEQGRENPLDQTIHRFRAWLDVDDKAAESEVKGGRDDDGAGGWQVGQAHGNRTLRQKADTFDEQTDKMCAADHLLNRCPTRSPRR
jgi:hypothetical protein